MSDTRDAVIQHGLPVVGGAVLGAFGAVWGFYEAQSAVALRPRLDDIDFLTAFLTGHGVDWLYLAAPTATAAAQVVVMVVAIWFGCQLVGVGA